MNVRKHSASAFLLRRKPLLLFQIFLASFTKRGAFSRQKKRPSAVQETQQGMSSAPMPSFDERVLGKNDDNRAVSGQRLKQTGTWLWFCVTPADSIASSMLCGILALAVMCKYPSWNIRKGNGANYRKMDAPCASAREEERSPLTDQILSCCDCNQQFTFTVGEQEFYASRGWPNVPSRCPECRAVRKRARAGRDDGQRRSQQEQESRPMYMTVCARCGKEARIPFQPRESRPVYCHECYQPQRTHSVGGNISRG